MARIFLFAPIGGIGGSVLGAFVWAIISAIKASTNEEAVTAAIQNGFGLLIFTPMFTTSTCLIVGSPMIYAFRRQLVENPIPWAALIAFLGMWLGVVCFGWAFVSHTNSEGLELLLVFSSSSAFSYASLYGWRTRAQQRAFDG